MAYFALILSLLHDLFLQKNKKIEFWEKHQNYYIWSYFMIVYFAGFNNGANLNIVVLWGALLTFNVNKQKLDWIGEKYILCTEFFKFLHQDPQGEQVGLKISQKIQLCHVLIFQLEGWCIITFQLCGSEIEVRAGAEDIVGHTLLPGDSTYELSSRNT